jgi:hypothetical protein
MSANGRTTPPPTPRKPAPGDEPQLKDMFGSDEDTDFEAVEEEAKDADSDGRREPQTRP